ncbi:MAG: hypothetical protein JWP89_6106 [Schlesneria sp.]|nr:hypothetical protein [Schlesneria sp.]
MMNRWQRAIATGVALSCTAISAYGQGPVGGAVKGAQNQVNGAQQGAQRAAGGVTNGAQQGVGGAVQRPPQAVPQPPRAVQQPPAAVPQAPKAVQPPRTVETAPRGIQGVAPHINTEPKSAVPNVAKPVVPPNPIRPNPVIPNPAVPKVNPAVPPVNAGRLPSTNNAADAAKRNLPEEVRTNKVPANGALDAANRNLPHRPVAGAQHNLGGTQINVGPRQINIANNGYRPAYNQHPRWYAGYWNGNYGSGWGYGGGWGNGYYGNNAYGYRPLGWGLGAWGLGTLAYNSGYLGYSNPYYTSGGYNGYNYAQPIPVAYDTTSTAVSSDNSTDDVLQAAVTAFQQNDYDQALDIVNKGITQSPSDAVLHEFRGLVLFAKADYQQAAATINSVLAVGPGWNWETIRKIYPSVAIYTNQLRSLESFVKQNPQDSASRFLLAYHYMIGGHQDAAASKLADVVRLTPDDRVAADLLQMLKAPAPGTNDAQTAATPSPQPPAPANRPAAADSNIDPATLVGSWSASRDDGSQFSLTLNKDGTFTWKFNQKNADQSFDGKYTVEGNVLALERKDGGSLVATVTPDGEQKFNFKLLGAPPSDPGLNFASANQ